MTTDAILETPSETTSEATGPSAGARLLSFLALPFRLRTLGRALYNLLAFPLGILYFVTLIVGTSVGVPLTLIWIGFLVLALTGALVWGFISFERELAKLLLGAEIAPMLPPSTGPLTITGRVGAFLGNPVTWKGAAFLILKFPLGITSFVTVVTSFSLSLTFLIGPFFFHYLGFRVDFGIFLWNVDTVPEAIVASLFGLVDLYFALHLMNALGLGWRWLAEGMLGSESHRAAPTAALPAAIDRVPAED